MKQEQQYFLIIGVLGTLAIIALFKDNTELATGIVGVLGGYLGAKHISLKGGEENAQKTTQEDR